MTLESNHPDPNGNAWIYLSMSVWKSWIVALSRPQKLHFHWASILQDDAALGEVIKHDLPPSSSVIFANEDVVKLVRELVHWEGFPELVLINHHKIVPVISVKDVLPVCDVLPDTSELTQVHASLVLSVKYRHDWLDSHWLNGAHVLLDSACWSLLSNITPLPSLSTLWKTFHRELWSGSTTPLAGPAPRQQR